MTREQILALAKQYSQYPDTKEMTLRGEAIVEFAEALLSVRKTPEGFVWASKSKN